MPAAQKLAEERNADVVLYKGPIDDRGFLQLASVCLDDEDEDAAPNIVLVLSTFGGQSDAAYRSARLLQERYERFEVLIPHMCKSAGTLLATGAHGIIMSAVGELGPLDVQVIKQDELEMRSGALVLSALQAVKEQSFDLFQSFMFNLKGASAGAFTLRTSTEIAAGVTTELFKEIVRQIDPNYLGEMSRNLKIAYEYGIRLAKIGGNISEANIHKLVYGYPEHGFVIDWREAGQLFETASQPNNTIGELLNELGVRGRSPHLLDFNHDIEKLSTPIRSISAGEETYLGRESNHQSGDTENERNIATKADLEGSAEADRPPNTGNQEGKGRDEQGERCSSPEVFERQDLETRT